MLKFTTLKSRIAFIFITLIMALQIIGAFAIRFSIDKNARSSVNEQLLVGENIFLSLLAQNGDNLTQGAIILAIDYGFREAIGSNDVETILSALNNHQSRIGAEVSVFVSSEHDGLIISGEIADNEIKPVISNLIKQSTENGSSKSFAIFHQQPYQLVAVPVKAPTVIGWIVMGFKINDKLAHKLHHLSNLEVTFINKSFHHAWKSTASTLNSSASLKLLKSVPSQLGANNMHLETKIEGIIYGTRYVPIYNSNDQLLYAVLQRSIDDATSVYRDLELSLILLTIIGLVVLILAILYVSKIITKPITDLVNSAVNLEKGKYGSTSSVKILEVHQRDELGNLGRTFNKMAEAIFEREKSISKLAYFDELTGLPNRTALILELSKSINLINSQQSGLKTLTILVLNLDRFKQINNILGHDVGDAILRILSSRIQVVIRKTGDFISRTGGDQFAILLFNTDTETAVTVSNQLLKSLETPIQMPNQTVDLSASVGIANYPEHGTSTAELLSRAEIAMHVAKLKNIGTVIFENAFDLHSPANLSLASDLKVAIEENQLELYVQPKISFQTGEVTTLEALIRWKHPQKGYIFPDQFIPYAEQTGLIHKVSMWMLNEAARLVSNWKERKIYIPIAVNISTRDLIDQNIMPKIMAIFDKYNIDVSDLLISLEITESSIMDDPIRALATLEKLASMHIKMAIDDFGTGYSSLTYLKKLPVSELKIDKSFVLKLEQDEDDKKIVKSTIDLGHNLGLKVVAEGIENKIVWDLLKEMGCDYGQGYYMGRPMHNSQFIQWLSNWDKSSVYQELIKRSTYQSEINQLSEIEN